MKKTTTLSMAAIMAFTVTGYGPSRPTETMTTGTAAAEIATESDTTTAGTTAEGEASGAASGKKYIINTDTTFVPSEPEDEEGEIVDIGLNTLQVIAQDQGFEYEVVPVGFSAAVTVLGADGCDGVITGTSITDERVQKYDFSKPYYDSGTDMAVLTGSDITSYDQLKDQKVAARINTEGCTFAESIAEQYGFEVTQHESSSDVYQAVLVDEVIVYFEDYPVIGHKISRGLDPIPPTPKEEGPCYGFAALGGVNPELVEMFNKGPENIKTNGRYDEIPNTYTVK